ncbi:unnamed protein product [Euphydryas editha]|uniref:THAP-type domain-containing protein n=1 Tax=Euphydryas editha TaxID=104508 RepID=A0AAU9URX1_EUPED|nr:unnamed protein product [Euphydryas editha]
MSNKVCCVPGCSNSAGSKDVLHKFPNPAKNNDRFNTWVYSVGGEILGLSNDHIFKYRRVCHKHFEEKYWCRSNLLSNIAVPTKNMPGLKLPILSFRESLRPFKSIQNLSEASTSKGPEVPLNKVQITDVAPQMKENVGK